MRGWIGTANLDLRYLFSLLWKYTVVYCSFISCQSTCPANIISRARKITVVGTYSKVNFSEDRCRQFVSLFTMARYRLIDTSHNLRIDNRIANRWFDMYNKKWFDNDNRSFQISICPCAIRKDENCEVRVPSGHCSTKAASTADASPMAVAPLAATPWLVLWRLLSWLLSFGFCSLCCNSRDCCSCVWSQASVTVAVPPLTAVLVAAASPIAAAQDAACPVAAAPLLGHHIIFI